MDEDERFRRQSNLARLLYYAVLALLVLFTVCARFCRVGSDAALPPRTLDFPMSSKFHWGKDGKPSCGSNSQALAAGFFYDCAGDISRMAGERVTACGVACLSL